MARPKMQPAYCWKIRNDELNIYLASSKRGALRIGMNLEEDIDVQDYFTYIYRDRKIIIDEGMNQSLIDAIEAVLKNRPMREDVSLDITGTPFQRRVWESLLEIPFGEKRTYGEVAGMVRKPKGARSVGRALGKNPLPLFYP